MPRLSRALAVGIVAAMWTHGCGGGSTPVHAPRTDLAYGYFQTVDGQLSATLGSVNFAFLQDDSIYGDAASRAWREDQQIARLQEAQALGPRQIMLSIGYLLFDAQFGYVGITALAVFRDRIASLGLLPMVRWLYVLDEPELHGVSDATMTLAMRDVRAIWPEAKLAVVYSAQGPTPGIAEADLVGRDDYQRGIDVTGELPAIRADQRYILMPGGTDPWRADPQPFLDYANAHPSVTMVMPFMWGARTDEHGVRAGIGTNAQASRYTVAGCSITLAC